jgi:predicted dehydrogenase
MPPLINIGIIGAGMIGDVHVKTAHADGRGEVTWLAARTRETLDRKMKANGVSRGTLDFREILADPKVDAVVIASPPHTHAEMTLAALDAGKHILLEKPMCIHPDEAKRIVAAVREHPNQVVLECSCRHARLQPKFRAIKKWIDDGMVGNVYHIHHNHLMRETFIEYNPAGTWALDKSKAGGGPFLDWGVYDLSFHLGILNDKPSLKSVRSFTRGGLKKFEDTGIRQDIEEHGATYMEFDTGLTYYYERGSGVHCEAANETRVNGTRGSLRFGFCSWDAPQVDCFFIDRDGNEKKEMLPVDMTSHTEDNQELMRHFLDCLLEGAAPMMTVDLAAKHLDVLFRILGKSS